MSPSRNQLFLGENKVQLFFVPYSEQRLADIFNSRTSVSSLVRFISTDGEWATAMI